MNSSCWRTTKKSFLAYVGNVVRVCTVNFTLSFSLSASDISTNSVFSPNGMDVVGVAVVEFALVAAFADDDVVNDAALLLSAAAAAKSASTEPCCLVWEICNGGVAVAELVTLSPLSSPFPPFSSCKGLPFVVVSSALSYKYTIIMI